MCFWASTIVGSLSFGIVVGAKWALFFLFNKRQMKCEKFMIL